MSLELETISDATKLFVGNLAHACDEADLSQLFKHYGHVVFVEIIKGESQMSLMHGFVKFRSHSDAVQAMSALQGFKFMGRCLR